MFIIEIGLVLFLVDKCFFLVFLVWKLKSYVEFKKVILIGVFFIFILVFRG